jgi:ribosomal-protein-alanine N-acetyltransferase
MTIEIKANEIEKIIEIEKNSFSNPWDINSYEKLLKDYESKIFVYLYENEIMAYAVFLDMVDVYELVKIAVKKEFRSKSIGSKFLEETIKELDKGIFLEVREKNEHAIALYKKVGFCIVNVRKNYYKDTGENAIIMSYDK